MSTIERNETETMLEKGNEKLNFRPKPKEEEKAEVVDDEKTDEEDASDDETTDEENETVEEEEEENEDQDDNADEDNEDSSEDDEDQDDENESEEENEEEGKEDDEKKELLDKLKELEEYRDQNVEANKAIIEAFEAEPVVAEIMKDIVNGLSIRQAFAKYFDPSDLEVEEGDPDEKDIKKIKEEREKSKKERDDYMKSLDENKKFSETAVNEFAKEKKMDEKAAGEFFNKVDKFLVEAYNGKLTKEFFDIMKKGFDYETEIEAARKTAEIKSRNEKIDMQKKKKKADGDGLPKIAGKGDVADKPEKPKTGLFRAMQHYHNKNVF